MPATESPDLVALHAAVLTDPADDLVRLAYADELESLGDEERAEFIRHQIANAGRRMAGLPVPATGNRELEIVQAMPDFLRLPGQTIDNYGWNGTGTTRIEYDSGAEAEFCRGFVSLVRCTQADWLKHGPVIVRQHPVEKPELTDKEPWTDTASGHRLWRLHPKAPTHDRREELDVRLFNRLTSGERLTHFHSGRGAHRWYRPEDDPLADLSSAALLWAKEMLPSPECPASSHF